MTEPLGQSESERETVMEKGERENNKVRWRLM